MKRPNCQHLDKETQSLIAKYCQGNGLDLGCGYQKIGACVGIDLVPWGAKSGSGISMADWSFDILHLPLKDNTMDFVYSAHVLEHLDFPLIAIPEWLRVLKSGGYLVMIVPNIDHCIPPIAKKKGLKKYHGLKPSVVKNMLFGEAIEWISFQSLSSIDVFEVVVRKL
jgi:SAM-dependent methyltransferase